MQAPDAGDTVDVIVAAWARELPEVDGLALELGKRVMRLAMAVTAATERELEPFGLTKAEYEILAVLHGEGEPYRLKPAVLAQRLMLSSGGTTNVLHRLTAAGLVVREPDPSDRRSFGVRLTDRGRETSTAAVLAVNAAQAELFAPLGEDGGRALARTLREAQGTLRLGAGQR